MDGGFPDKNSFWKVQRLLASVRGGFGNKTTDKTNIRCENENEFKPSLRTRETDGQLKKVETMQNNLGQLQRLLPPLR